MSNEKLNDAQIIELVLNGDIDKFELLVERYQKLVFGFLLSKSDHLELAEDIFQEAFIRAYKHLGGFDCKRKFSTWIVAIAKNVMFDYKRNSNRIVTSTELVTKTMNCLDVNKQSLPEDILVRKEAFSDLRTIIERLSQDLREPFLLRIVNEMSYEEISQALNIPLQTVKNRIFKARTLLRKKKNEKMP